MQAVSTDLRPIQEACEAALRAASSAGLFGESWPDFDHWYAIETHLLDDNRALVAWADKRTHPVKVKGALIPSKAAEMRLIDGEWTLTGFFPADAPERFR